MSKETDTARDDAIVKTDVHLSRDNVDTDSSAQPDTDKKPGEEEEFVETVDLDDPPDDKSDDGLEPRERIARKHQTEQRTEFEPVGDKPEEEVADTDDSGVDKQNSDGIINDDNPEMVEIVVYGRSRLVEKSKVDKAGGVQAYQKEQAVHYGFQEVATQRELNDKRGIDLDAREAAVKEKEVALPTLDEQHADPDLPKPGDQTIEKLTLQYHEALLDGDTDETARLFTQLNKTNQSNPVQVDIEKITSDVSERAADIIEQRTRVRQEKQATQSLMDAHPELNRKDPKYDARLFATVDDEATVVERENPEWEPSKVLNEAYKRVQDWKGKPKQDALTARQQEKRNLHRPVISSERAPGKPEIPKKTDSDYVKQIRKNRGLDV